MFYVLEGEHVFRVGDEESRVGPGGVVFRAPGGTARTAAGGAAQRREVVLTFPGGLEGFFFELAEADRGATGTDVYARASKRYGSPGWTKAR